MKVMQGQNRKQINLFLISLYQSIDQWYEVRIIDLFVFLLSVKKTGFRTEFFENCRLSYHPSNLLKLFIYAYLNKVRSSIYLETEYRRNIEVEQLLKYHRSVRNIISTFRRDYPKTKKTVFRATVQIVSFFNLIRRNQIEGGRSKLRAQSSKKNNYPQAKIDGHQALIDKKHEDFQETLAVNDGNNQHHLDDFEVRLGRINKYKNRRNN